MLACTEIWGPTKTQAAPWACQLAGHDATGNAGAKALLEGACMGGIQRT